MRQLTAIGFAIGLSGCSSIPFMDSVPFIDNEPKVPLGEVGFIQGFFGGVAADEPRAALAGRDVLTAGGSAADAAAAIYFTLAVTMPSAAGLGGGGMCVVRDPNTQRVETLDFLGQNSSGSGRKILVPSNARGIFALHAKFGKLEWRELIRPAENLARFGGQVSRAFAEDLRRAQGVLSASKHGRKVFIGKNGKPLSEGVRLKQPDLASSLSRLRARGPAFLFAGTDGQIFAEEVRRIGFDLTYRDLKATRPIWRSTLRVPFVHDTNLHFAMPRSPSGTMAAKMAAMLINDDRYEDAKPDERAHLISETIQRAVADGANGFKTVTVEREFNLGSKGRKIESLNFTQITDEYAEKLMAGYKTGQLTQLAAQGSELSIANHPGGETSFSVIDLRGGAVACAFTMNGAFGTGRVVPGTGIFLANSTASPTMRDLSMATVIVDHNFLDKFYMVGAASGGAASQAVLTQISIAAAVNAQTSLDTEITERRRVFRDVARRITYVETGAPVEFINNLKQRGHRTVAVPSLARVNIALCDNGLPEKNTQCRINTDPRGFGYATTPE
jgi:gamma-glutamyltranspeptidase / glutathione hydrolase